MSVTQYTDLIAPQILGDVVRGKFKGKNAFAGSALVAAGAVIISGTMPKGGPGAIGKTIEIPYFGSIGEFASNAEGSSPTPTKLAQTSETATIARASLAVETSIWAQGLAQVDPALGDPYQEAADQAVASATRFIDQAIITEFATTPLVRDVYSATTPVYMDWDTVIKAKRLWGDEQDDIVGLIVHSTTLADMSILKSSTGAPLLLSNMTQGQGQIMSFGGVPVTTSDRMPLTGSSMGTVVSTGTAPPVATLAGTPTGPWSLQIDAQTGTATTVTFKFSTDGGNTWSAILTALDDSVAVALTDTAVDSLVGNNGATGLTVAFAAGTFNADNLWVSTALIKASSLIVKRGSGAFWYNAQRLGAKTDVDILEDTDIMAMHLYHAPKLYRRCRMGARPGVVKIIHNARDFIG